MCNEYIDRGRLSGRGNPYQERRDIAILAAISDLESLRDGEMRTDKPTVTLH